MRTPIILAGLLIGAQAAAIEDPGKNWRDGPVRYLLTDSEHRSYGKLDSPADREAYVREFWRRRDPDPGTVVNEYREIYRRARELADEWFQESAEPGWRTDRGRVLLLLGVPDSVRRDAGGSRARDREIWTYDRQPGGVATPLEIVFHRDEAGLFRLDDSPPLGLPGPSLEVATHAEARRQLTQELYWTARMSYVQLDQLASIILDTPTGFAFEEFTRSPPPAAGSSPGPARVPAADAADGFSEQAYFFRAADGTTLVMLAVALEQAGRPGESNESEPPYSAVAWLLDETSEQGPSVSTVPLWADAREPGAGRFGGNAYLSPGEYRLRYAVGQPDTGSLFVRSKTLSVPRLDRPGLSASSVVPAESFGPAVGKSPFVVGSEQVVPRPGATFSRGEPLRLYLQLYGATLDAQTGRPRIDVVFRFERARRSRFKRQGKPLELRGADGASMGLALPIGDWSPGEYRVRVECQDRITGARVSTAGGFRVVD